MKKKSMAAALIAALVFTTVTAFAAESNVVSKPAFTDTNPGSWYYSYMSKLVDKGAVNGYPDKTFKPQNTMTNAEFITTIVGATVGKQEKTGTHWASGYMDAARKNEILIGDEMQEVDWNKAITRQQMAVVIGRTTDKILKEEPIADTSKFQAELKDYDKLCDSCKPYILQSYGKGIISGYPDGTFGGEKTATRAEVCSMLTRMLEPADRTMEKIVEPELKGKIEEVISNPEDIFGGFGLTSYVISDPKLWNMELFENEFAKYVKMKNPGLSSFVIDGKVVQDFGVTVIEDGYAVVNYEYLLHKDNMQGQPPTDITKVDYIVSYSTVNPVLTLIPNPFKQ